LEEESIFSLAIVIERIARLKSLRMGLRLFQKSPQTPQVHYAQENLARKHSPQIPGNAELGYGEEHEAQAQKQCQHVHDKDGARLAQSL